MTGMLFVHPSKPFKYTQANRRRPGTAAEKPYSLRLGNDDRTISARRRRQLIAGPNLAISAVLHYASHKLPACHSPGGTGGGGGEGLLSCFPLMLN